MDLQVSSSRFLRLSAIVAIPSQPQNSTALLLSRRDSTRRSSRRKAHIKLQRRTICKQPEPPRRLTSSHPLGGVSQVQSRDKTTTHMFSKPMPIQFQLTKLSVACQRVHPLPNVVLRYADYGIGYGSSTEHF
jgi:hypothetical protein